MSCFRENRVWKFVKIDVDDGDEEWNEQRQIYREYLKVEFLRKYYGFEIFQIAFFWTSSIPPIPSSPFFYLFFFFLFLLFTIRCIWNFPPLKFKIDRLISPVLTPRYFRFLLLIPRRGKRMNYYLIIWKDIIKNLIPIDAHWRNHLLTGSLAKPGPTFLPNFLRVETTTRTFSNLTSKRERRQRAKARETRITNQTFVNLLKPSQTFSNLASRGERGEKRREKRLANNHRLE